MLPKIQDFNKTISTAKTKRFRDFLKVWWEESNCAMIMKLTGIRDLVWAPSDPREFDHNSISKKMRPMRKKSLTWLRNIRIFYHFKSFEMVKMP